MSVEHMYHSGVPLISHTKGNIYDVVVDGAVVATFDSYYDLIYSSPVAARKIAHWMRDGQHYTVYFSLGKEWEKDYDTCVWL